MAKVTQVYCGEVISWRGSRLLVNTSKDEPIELTVKDENLQRELYCKAVKITVETISDSELWANVKGGGNESNV